MTPEEIKFFDNLAPVWDQNEKRSTASKVRDIIGMAGIRQVMRILDLGTGTGVLIPFLSSQVGQGGAVDAIDISEGMLNRAREKYGHLENVKFTKLDFESQSIQGKYDLIFLYCVYPHLHTPRETLLRLASCNLNDDGKIIIAFPSDEKFINSIHEERKAESDMLPSAPSLAARITSWGMPAKVLAYDEDRYVISVSKN